MVIEEGKLPIWPSEPVADPVRETLGWRTLAMRSRCCPGVTRVFVEAKSGVESWNSRREKSRHTGAVAKKEGGTTGLLPSSQGAVRFVGGRWDPLSLAAVQCVQSRVCCQAGRLAPHAAPGDRRMR